jgi:hypothetical protein
MRCPPRVALVCLSLATAGLGLAGGALAQQAAKPQAPAFSEVTVNATDTPALAKGASAGVSVALTCARRSCSTVSVSRLACSTATTVC